VESLQLAEPLKLPPLSDAKLTVPPGALEVPGPTSTTVAVHVEALPTATEPGLQSTDTVADRIATESCVWPSLEA
jgi:hypothetical protein